MTLEKFHERRHEIIRKLTDLRGLGAHVGARSIAARVEAEVISKLEADRFNLVVVGEFNHGKSTFVNALLGRSILPSGVTPTTAVIHHLRFANEPSARVVFDGGREEPLSFDALREWSAHDEAPQRSAEARYIEIGYPSKLLSDGVVLVDTPGVNDLSLQRADITYSYIPRSDAVLFLLDAGQMLKESERVFLVEKLIGKSRDKIIFVVNKVDIWSPEERQEALAYVHRELGKIVKSPVIFPLSAQAAVAGRVEGSGLPELIDHLSRFLANERGRIILDNALAEGLSACGLFEQSVEAKRHGLKMSSEELDRRLAIIRQDADGHLHNVDARRAAIREEVAAIKAWAKRDLSHFVDDVCRQIPNVVDRADSDDLRQHLGAFLESTFREWAQSETQEIARALQALAEKTIAMLKEDAEEASKRVGDTLQIKAPTIEVDRLPYDFGVAVLGAAGLTTLFINVFLGGALLVATPLLALYLRDRVDTKTRDRAKEIAPGALREAAAQVGPKIDQMIEDFASQLDQWVVNTGKEMYRGILEVLTAAREERDAHKGTEAANLAVLDEQGRRLGEVKASLEAMRRELWDGVVRAEVVDERGEPPVPEPAPLPPPEAPSPEMSAMQDGDA